MCKIYLIKCFVYQFLFIYDILNIEGGLIVEDSIKKYIEYSKKVNKYDEKIEKALCE